MARIVILASVPLSFSTLLRDQPRALARHHEVILITSPGPAVQEIAAHEGVRVIEIEMTRQITPWRDLRALLRLRKLLRELRPDIVHTYTPKAGLLGMLAAALAGVRHRVHSVIGLPLMEARGVRRVVLQATERLTYACSTHLLANSRGLAQWMGENLTRRPVRVLGAGSINGLDMDRFSAVSDPAANAALRASLSIPDGDRIVVFVGRLVKDKGVGELVAAFGSVDTPATLVLIGDLEPGLDPLDEKARHALEHDPRIRRVGFVQDVRPYLAIADICVLPSYREGLPNSLLEAGAMGVPLIASDINGCNEIVIEGVNGMLVPPKDADALRSALTIMLRDADLRARLRAAARPSIEERFAQPAFHAVLATFYAEVLAS